MAQDSYHDYPQRDLPGTAYRRPKYSGAEYPASGSSRPRYGEGRHEATYHAEWREAASDRPNRPELQRGSTRGGGPRRPTRRRKKRNPKAAFALIAVLGLGTFAAGFLGMWSVGSLIVGGPGLGGGGLSAAVATPLREDYQVEPLVDLLAFRDLAYVPVKGVHFYPRRAGNTDYVGKVIEVIDRTELNTVVITMKDDEGWLAYDSDLALAKRYGTVNPDKGIADLDALLENLAQHNIIAIARIPCFKDGVLAGKRPELAVQTPTGEVFVDGEGSRWLNPFNHEVWEYLVQVGEELAHRGFREIQFDYVRFPTAKTANATYPGRYCAKEDAIAGFLAYARPRLEAMGVWVSADVFGWVVGRTDDVGMGQKLEKMCQNVDILCPMVYPSLYGPWSYGIEYPPAEPYRTITAAMTDAKNRLAGTGTKGRPYLQVVDDKKLFFTAEMIKEEVRAAEELGFNEWIFWGGYDEAALRSAEGVYATEITGSTSTTVPGGR